MDRLKHFLLRLALVTALAAVSLVPSASIAAAADEATVISQLQDGRVYIEPGAEAVDLTVINNAITKAETCGIRLYVAVLAEEDTTYNAEDVRRGIGDGTVALFRPLSFNLASNEIDENRFNRAETIANPVLTDAFAHVAVSQFIDAACELPVDEGGGRMRWLWLAIGALLVLGIGGLLLSMLGRSRRAVATSESFEKRRVVLSDWAAELRAPVTELQGPVAATRSDALATMYNDALAVARESEADIAASRTEADLDRTEIRIARAWMQLRDIRKAIAD